MHRRYQASNIPTEIIRTIAVVAETGSFSKAGDRLGLSQPAISSQVKRLQLLVGGPIFDKASPGITFTPKGKLILAYARRLLDANDQILLLGGAATEARPIRLGLSLLYVERFLEVWRSAEHPACDVSIVCDHSSELAKALAEGYLDVACLVNPPPEVCDPVVGWEEDFVWVRSRDFVLSPGSPIPLIGWLNSVADQSTIQDLEKAGLSYRIVFSCSDHHARMAAVGASVGLMSLPKSQISEPLVVATEYYLPAMLPRPAGVYLRPNTEMGSFAAAVAHALKLLAPQNKRASAQPA
jgi:DNA-binding transcriptional LysR family regulator